MARSDDADGKARIALRLALLALALMTAQSFAGVGWPGVYRDEGFALDAWRLNDPITLGLAVPITAVALALAWRGALRGWLVLVGAMQYALYNYAFYLFGAALNAHFLVYAAALTASALALVAGLAALDVGAVARAVSPRAPLRPIAAYMGTWALILGVAWIGQALAFVGTGQAPELGEEAFRLIAALDLTLVVTPVAIGAAWLWARRPWGVVLAVVMNVKGAIYATLLTIGSAQGGPLAAGGGDGLLWLWAFFAVGSTASLVALLAAIRDHGAYGSA